MTKPFRMYFVFVHGALTASFPLNNRLEQTKIRNNISSAVIWPCNFLKTFVIFGLCSQNQPVVPFWDNRPKSEEVTSMEEE